jgi:CheY-like chemotaxis protein
MEIKRLKCVLIIDDDRVSNYLTENVLRGMGIATMINTVTDGQAGLEYIKYQCLEEEEFEYTCPDLIILDLNMRLMNGIEFVKQYRKLNVPKKSVIVVLSTLPLQPEQKRELEKLEIYDFFVKPLSGEKLIAIMEDHFSPAH